MNQLQRDYYNWLDQQGEDSEMIEESYSKLDKLENRLREIKKTVDTALGILDQILNPEEYDEVKETEETEDDGLDYVIKGWYRGKAYYYTKQLKGIFPHDNWTQQSGNLNVARFASSYLANHTLDMISKKFTDKGFTRLVIEPVERQCESKGIYIGDFPHVVRMHGAKGDLYYAGACGPKNSDVWVKQLNKAKRYDALVDAEDAADLNSNTIRWIPEDGEPDVVRVGYDPKTKKFITFDQGKFVDEDGYVKSLLPEAHEKDLKKISAKKKK